ncbi:MAG: hypothetical protein ACXW00_00420 [Methylobacter sp.]
MQNKLILRVRPASGCTKNIPPGNKSGKKSGHPYVPRVNLGGNFCDHRPDAPRFFVPPEKHAKLPLLLRKTQAAIQDYFWKTSLFPQLNGVNRKLRKNGSNRQQRSERREACIDLLGCILQFTDLVTLRVGIPQKDGSMKGWHMSNLAELSGLSERRAERAIRDLKNAGFITVHPICEKLADATYKGFAAIRTVSQHLFTVLGLDKWLKHERQKATERRLHRSEKKRRQELAKVQMAMNGQKPKISKAVVPGKRTGKMTSIADHFAAMRAPLVDSPPD